LRITDAVEFINSKKGVKLQDLAESLNLTVDDAKQFVNILERYKFIEFDEENDIIKLTNLVDKTLRKDHGF